MRLFETFLVLFSIWNTPSLARFAFGDNICLTEYGTKSVKQVPTYSSRSTVTFSFTVTHTTIPTVTTTPIRLASTTVLSTAYTTNPTVTDTIFSTVTSSATSTVFVTTTVQSSATITVTTTTQGTATAAVSPGFTPFASLAAVIAAGGGAPLGGSSKRSESWRYSREVLHHLQKRDVQKICPPGTPQKYPQSVKCYIYVNRLQVVKTTVAARFTKTRTAATSTSTVTSTSVTTLTVNPSHVATTVINTITSTGIVTSTVSSTSISTLTSTTTSVLPPTSTVYPQCQNDNLIASVGGNKLYYLSPGSTNPLLTTTTDAETCCQICVNTANCAGFSGPSPGFTDCYLFIATTCDATISYWTVYNANGQTSDLSIVGNGNCGQGNYGGSL